MYAILGSPGTNFFADPKSQIFNTKLAGSMRIF